MSETLVKGYIRIMPILDPLQGHRRVVLVDKAGNTITEFFPGKEVTVQLEYPDKKEG